MDNTVSPYIFHKEQYNNNNYQHYSKIKNIAKEVIIITILTQVLSTSFEGHIVSRHDLEFGVLQSQISANIKQCLVHPSHLILVQHFGNQ